MQDEDWNCHAPIGSTTKTTRGDAAVCFQNSGCVSDWVSLPAVCPCHLVGCAAMQRTRSPAGETAVPHNGDVAATSATNREEHVRRGRRLEYFTIGYNSLEGVISIVAGLIAGSVSLVGFGLDSLIEVTSGAALVWRLHHDLNVARREQVERTALRTVGACFIALAMYIFYESSSLLVRHEKPERSIPGIV